MKKFEDKHEVALDQKIAVSRSTLAQMLEVSQKTADKLGLAAGAKIYLGRRALYKVDAVKLYLDNLTADAE